MTTLNDQVPLTPVFSSIDHIRENSGRFLLFGILLVILGFAAVYAAGWTTLIAITTLGFLLLVGGVAKLIYSFWVRQWSGFFFSLLGGLLYTGAGVLCLAKPITASAAITLLIGSLFLVNGLFKAIISLVYQFEQWGWVLLSGIISIALGGMVLAEWPLTSLWVIGLFIGIDLIFYGWTLILLALAARQSAHPKKRQH